MSLRGAIIGFGNVAANGHVPGWLGRDDVALVAAADPHGARRDALADALPGARFYDSPGAMLAAERPDFVDICTPPGSHAALIRLAHDAGAHVLCEKPTATRTEDLAAAASAARRRGLVLHTVHNWLKAPVCRKVTALIDDGALGTVQGIRWETLRTRPAVTVAAGGAGNWRTDPHIAGGGILVDHGWHALYCVVRWAGLAPETVVATLERRKFTDWPLEDSATLSIGFPGVRARIHLTWAAGERVNRIEIEGNTGRLSVDGDRVTLTADGGRRAWACPPALSEGSHHPDWFRAVADDFVGAIGRAGRGAEGNLAEALLCARLIERARASSEAGGAMLPFAA